MYFLSVIVLFFLFLETFGRPTHVLQDYDKESKDNSYRDSDSGKADDYQYDDRKSALKQFADEPASKADLDENNSGTNEERDHPRHDKDYLENDEEQSDAAHLLHNDVSNVKRTATFSNSKLFHDEKPQKIEADEYNEDDRVRSNHKERYLKQYHPLHNIDRDGLIRDRREIQNNNLNNPMSAEEISTQKNDLSASEDEETAIRRHVKKLSKDELDELLHSLSEDKRTLLKNIIDNSQQDYDNVNKREITKKAGANEENSLVGNEQSDTNKIQGGSANFEAEPSLSPNMEDQDDTKKADDSVFSKSTETPTSTDKTDKNNVLEGIVDKISVKADNIENLETSETEPKISGNSESEKEAPKNDNKREVNSKTSIQSEPIREDPAILKSSNKEDLYCSDNEALSQLWSEESSLFNDNKYKREACSDDIDAIKSLGESFPNADNGNDFKLGSDMAPLVRVKRDNPPKKIYKRDENVVSNLKVPYFSSALENNEEESDEGGEFQDDGFFDRGVHFAKPGELIKRGIDTSKGNRPNNVEYCRKSQPFHMDKNKLETDTAGLGSDTDVVLSGIEGVDDNMMYNSAARIRRTGKTFDNSFEGDIAQIRQENNQQIASQNENNQISEDNNNAARYQENDAFGSLPRNYEQDLGRFKRIRRLKQDNNVPAVK